MQRRRARLERTTTAIDELLRGQDYPEAVRRAVALALKGGRWSKQLCLKCGKRARNLNIYAPAPVLSPVQPGPGADTKVALYWLCDLDRGTLDEDAVRALLGRGQGPSVETAGAGER